MTAPEAAPRGLDTNARGLMVLAVALIVGFLLLYSWGPGKGSSSASNDTKPPGSTAPLDGSTTTVADAGTTTTAGGSSRAPSEVSVIVLNGGAPAGSAETTSGQVGETGYTMLQFGNAGIDVEETSVFYAEGYQEDAIGVASLLGQTTDVVKPLEESGLTGAEGDADVVVVLGPNAPPVDSTTTTTTG